MDLRPCAVSIPTKWAWSGPVGPHETMQADMTAATDDIIRFTAGTLLRGPHQGRFLCSPCLVEVIRDRLSTTYMSAQIERALEDVFKTPGSLKRLPLFVCDQCGQTLPCLGARPRSRATAD